MASLPRIRCGGSRAIASVFLVTVLVALSGCSGSGDQDTPPVVAAAGDTADAGDIPEFMGPWASDFTLMYSRASTDFERSVLADGAVTDQEFSEMQDRYGQCLTDIGFTNISFQPDGGFQFDTPEGAAQKTVEDQVKVCAHDSGDDTIGALYTQIRRNPENQDESAIMAACLVRKGVVDPAYGADDYADDVAEFAFPFLSDVSQDAAEQAFGECNADPLGLLE